MQRLIAQILAFLIIFTSVEPAFAGRFHRGPGRGVHRGPHRRTVVVVRPGHPIRRPLRTVYIRPYRGAIRPIVPLVFLPLVVWSAAASAHPQQDHVVWEDSETLTPTEDWTEFSLSANNRGQKLLLEVSNNPVQIDFAEVVFENGDCQVVDFNEASQNPGTYSLLDFKDGRKVDHVRVIARAPNDSAKLALLMQK